MPRATNEERETARASLYRFVALVIRHNERLMASNPPFGIGAAGEIAVESESSRIFV